MSQRIWRKKLNKFPTLFYLKVGEICRNAYVQKMQ